MQLTEAQVTSSNLANALNNAFMDTDSLDSESFKVQLDHYKYKIVIDKDRKFIRISDFNNISHMNKSTAVDVINTLNNQYIFVKFYAMEFSDGLVLVSEHDLSYEKGLNLFHLVDCLKKMDSIIFNIVKEGIFRE